MDRTTAPEHSKPVRLAHAVLLAAIDNDWPKATRAFERLNAECDANGLALALVAWCDAHAEHSQGGPPEFGKVRIVDFDVDSGASLTDETRTPQIRWANRLIAARAAGDRHAFTALLEELNQISDGFERGKYANALLLGVSGTMRSFPRGYARMGQSESIQTYRVARCGQLSAHPPHVVEHGPDQPRNCPGVPGLNPGGED